MNNSIQPTSLTRNHTLNTNNIDNNHSSNQISNINNNNNSIENSDTFSIGNINIILPNEMSSKRTREDFTRRTSYLTVFNELKSGLQGAGEPKLEPQLPPITSLAVDSLQVNRDNLSGGGGPVGLLAGIQQQQPNVSIAPELGPPLQIPLHHLANHHQQHHHLNNLTLNHHQQQTQNQHQDDTLQIQQSNRQLQHQQHHQSHHQQQEQSQLQQPQQQQQQPHGQIGNLMQTTNVRQLSGGGEDVTNKRELRLQKNREAAKECRRKKKEYIKCLENRVAVLENQNKALIDELKTLKDLYCKTANE